MADAESLSAARPATPLYYAGMHCHECGGTNFWVRNTTAECGNSRCGSAYAIFAKSQPHHPLPEAPLPEKENADVR